MSSRSEHRQQPPDVDKLLEQLGPPARISHDRRPLMRNSGSLRVTVMAEAWQDAGLSLENPGKADQYYYRDQGIVLLDLEGRFED